MLQGCRLQRGSNNTLQFQTPQRRPRPRRAQVQGLGPMTTVAAPERGTGAQRCALTGQPQGPPRPLSPPRHTWLPPLPRQAPPVHLPVSRLPLLVRFQCHTVSHSHDACRSAAEPTCNLDHALHCCCLSVCLSICRVRAANAPSHVPIAQHHLLGQRWRSRCRLGAAREQHPDRVNQQPPRPRCIFLAVTEHRCNSRLPGSPRGSQSLVP